MFRLITDEKDRDKSIPFKIGLFLQLLPHLTATQRFRSEAMCASTFPRPRCGLTPAAGRQITARATSATT